MRSGFGSLNSGSDECKKNRNLEAAMVPNAAADGFPYTTILQWWRCPHTLPCSKSSSASRMLESDEEWKREQDEARRGHAVSSRKLRLA